MSSNEEITLVYDAGPISVDELEQDLDALWSELRTGGRLRQDALAAGVDDAALGELLGQERRAVIALERKGAGLDPGGFANGAGVMAG